MKFETMLRGITWCWCIGIGLVMIASGWIHLNNTIALHQSILEYRMVGEAGARALATVLPPLQFGIGLTLVAYRYSPRIMLMAGLLLALFAVAQWRVVLGGLEISCGCFGPWSRMVTWVSAAVVTIAAALTSGLAWASMPRYNFNENSIGEVNSC